MSRVLRFWIIGFALLVFGVVLALKTGAVQDADWTLIQELRLPRVILALAIGAGLAVSGAALQAVFSNPLCEPYTLGISSGAALGAVIGAMFGLNLNWLGLAGPSFIGALVFTLILLWASGHVSGVTVLLVGVMLGFFGSSWVAVGVAMTDANGLQSAIYWLLGDLSRAQLGGSWMVLGSVAIMIALIRSRSRELDALLLGEEAAMSLGVPVPLMRRKVILTVSLLTAACVSAAGMIGFVGLLVPHLVRRTCGVMHGRLIPLAALWGGLILLYADTLVRVLPTTSELPVGVVTALIGSPVFVWMMLRSRRGNL